MRSVMDGAAIAVDPSLAMKTYFVPQGISADIIATEYGFTRDEADALAVESQRRAAEAWQDRRFAKSIVPVKDQNGILILDQRNYDEILDHGFKSKHKYYYCGDRVSAEPEHVDEGLARFRYGFPDGSEYHLNMFPLRKDYTRRLMTEVGFQRIETYGDFQETHPESQPDFYIHVAHKHYETDEEATAADLAKGCA